MQNEVDNREKINILHNYLYCMTFVDLRRLWPEIQTPKQQCLLTFCLLFSLSQRPLSRRGKALHLPFSGLHASESIDKQLLFTELV